jgi:hypothetical protein
MTSFLMCIIRQILFGLLSQGGGMARVRNKGNAFRGLVETL